MHACKYMVNTTLWLMLVVTVVVYLTSFRELLFLYICSVLSGLCVFAVYFGPF